MGRMSKCAGQALLDDLAAKTVERLKNDRDAVSRTGYTTVLTEVGDTARAVLDAVCRVTYTAYKHTAVGKAILSQFQPLSKRLHGLPKHECL
jgi:hypothetical protein